MRYAQFLPDNIHAVVSSQRKEVVHINTLTGDVLGRLYFPKNIRTLSISYDSQYLLTTIMGLTQLWDVYTFSEVRRWDNTGDSMKRGIEEMPYRFSICSPTADYILLGDIEGNLELWTSESVEPLKTFQNPLESDSSGIAISPDNKKVASAYNNHNYFTVWDVHTGVVQMSDYKMQPVGINSIAFSPDSFELLVSKWDLYKWDVRDNLGEPEPIIRLDEVDQAVNALGAAIYSPDGQLICACDVKQQVFLFDHVSGELVQWFPRHSGMILNLAFSSDGKRLLSLSTNSVATMVLRIWDIETGAKVNHIDFSVYS